MKRGGYSILTSGEMKKCLEDYRPVEESTELVREWVDWGYVKDVHANDKVIQVNVFGFNRGGILVRNDYLHGFVPCSHLVDCAISNSATMRQASIAKYLGRTISVKVIECSEPDERIVLSERAASAGEGSRSRLLATLHSGDIASGKVTNITRFGVFVDLGGVEGLVHISELSWGKVIEPARILHVGQEINVQVMNVDEKECRISLSIKRLYPNPWNSLAEKYHPGDRLSAVITSVTRYGVFAQLEEGIEGLVHISAFGGDMTPDDLRLRYKTGQKIIVCILRIDIEHHKLGLGPVNQ